MNITAAEAELMKVLWERSPIPSEELVAALGPAQSWSETTIRTLLSRLVKKGAVATVAEGRRFLYRPMVSRDDYLHDESRGLIERLFDGRVGPFVAQLSAREKLSPEDIADLKRLIGELEDGE